MLLKEIDCEHSFDRLTLFLQLEAAAGNKGPAGAMTEKSPFISQILIY